jgi:4-hydroxybenzoate polyprenyltransferase
MNWKTYLTLGRVSNLPTVASNALCGVVLAAGVASPGTMVALVFALSSFYVGGMFLNDAFDRHIDAKVHPERPIPSGRIGARQVFAIGFVLLALGEVALVVVAHESAQPWHLAAIAGFALGGLIVLYDAWHKNNPVGPLLMGGCRMLVYLSAALAVSGTLSAAVVRGSLVLLSYLIGLTYVAKQETLARFQNFWPLLFLLAPFVYAPLATREPTWAFWALHLGFLAWVFSAVVLLQRRAKGNIPRAVVRLIAGISLVDALLMFAGNIAFALAAVACFGSTLALQRFVRGT